MKIESIMTTEVVTIEMDDTLGMVKEIFDNLKFHHLLVIDDGILIGVVSDRDLYRAISPNIGTSRFTYRDVETLEKKVHSVMTRHPVTLKTTATLKDAIAIFNSHSFSCIPVVDEENRIKGIITWRDIFKNLQSIIPADTLN